MQSNETQFQSELGRRISYAREAAKMSQEQLAKALRFKDRQTLSMVENGQRKLSADELLALMRATGRDLEFFTDNCRLVGEGAFSFRAGEIAPAGLNDFEERAGRWIATYRRLGYALGQPRKSLGYRLTLTARSSYEEAWAVAEGLVKEWQLGDVPAARLAGMTEEHLDVLVLYFAGVGVSGAACRLADLDTILINRGECAGRRNFDLAHELFHLLTWDTMPPARDDHDAPRGYSAKRIEQLADNFAGALLMPEQELRRRWDKRGSADLHDWLNRTATVFNVTASALKWRLKYLTWLTEVELSSINDKRLVANGEAKRKAPPPPLFSRKFFERLYRALDEGCISARRAAQLVETDIAGLAALLKEHGCKVPFDL